MCFTTKEEVWENTKYKAAQLSHSLMGWLFSLLLFMPSPCFYYNANCFWWEELGLWSHREWRWKCNFRLTPRTALGWYLTSSLLVFSQIEVTVISSNLVQLGWLASQLDNVSKAFSTMSDTRVASYKCSLVDLLEWLLQLSIICSIFYSIPHSEHNLWCNMLT